MPLHSGAWLSIEFWLKAAWSKKGGAGAEAGDVDMVNQHAQINSGVHKHANLWKLSLVVLFIFFNVIGLFSFQPYDSIC